MKKILLLLLVSISIFSCEEEDIKSSAQIEDKPSAILQSFTYNFDIKSFSQFFGSYRLTYDLSCAKGNCPSTTLMHMQLWGDNGNIDYGRYMSLSIEQGQNTIIFGVNDIPRYSSFVFLFTADGASNSFGTGPYTISSGNLYTNLADISSTDGYWQVGEVVDLTSIPNNNGTSYFNYQVRIKYTYTGQTQYQYIHTNSLAHQGSKTSNVTLFSNPGLAYSTIQIQILDMEGGVLKEIPRTIFSPSTVDVSLDDGYPRLGETVPITSSANGNVPSYDVRIKYTLYGQVQYQYVHSHSGATSKTTNVTLWSNPGLGYSTMVLQVLRNGIVLHEYNRTLFP